VGFPATEDQRLFTAHAKVELGPGLPEPMSDQVPPNEHRHRLPVGWWLSKGGRFGQQRPAQEFLRII
jgi:hypothetical protein